VTTCGLRFEVQHTAIRTAIDDNFPPCRILVLDQPLPEITKILVMFDEPEETHEAAMKSSKQFAFKRVVSIVNFPKD
jgi:hypothetical protein